MFIAASDLCMMALTAAYLEKPFCFQNQLAKVTANPYMVCCLQHVHVFVPSFMNVVSSHSVTIMSSLLFNSLAKRIGGTENNVSRLLFGTQIHQKCTKSGMLILLPGCFRSL